MRESGPRSFRIRPQRWKPPWGSGRGRGRKLRTPGAGVEARADGRGSRGGKPEPGRQEPRRPVAGHSQGGFRSYRPGGLCRAAGENPAPTAGFRRKRRCAGPSAGRSTRDLSSANAAHQGGSGGCAGEKPARSGAKTRVSGPRTGATGWEKPVSWRKKPGFPGDCPRRVTGSRLCARLVTRTRAHGQARFAHV